MATFEPTTVIVPPQAVPVGELRRRVETTQHEFGDVLQQYHDVWYRSGHTWVCTQFLGVQMMKNPNDLWVYQDILSHYRPQTVIETGTYTGASAMWFAFLQAMLCIEGGRVLTVDIENHRRCGHSRITFLEGDSVDPAIVARVRADTQGPVLVVLDSDHGQEHVYQELCAYAPLVGPGDWLVVEDVDVWWPDCDGGARAALQQYLSEHPGEFRQDVLCERYLLSCNAWLQRRPLEA